MSIGLTNSNLLSATTESFQEELIFDRTLEGFTSSYVAAGPSLYMYQGQFEEILFKLEKDTEYKVIFDGVEYILPSDKIPSGGGPAPVDYYLGDENLLLFSASGTNAPNVFPFVILPCDVRSMGAPFNFMLMIATTLEGESHSIQIYKTGRKNTGKLIFEVNDFTDFDPESSSFNASNIFALIPNYEYKIVINGEEFNCQTFAEMNFESGDQTVIIHDFLERFYMECCYPDGEIFITLGIKSDSYDIQIYKMHEKETLIDLSLEASGQAADANVVGGLFNELFNKINNISSLPSVTTSDVGKILQVNSNGQWAAVLISSAENSGF